MDVANGIRVEGLGVKSALADVHEERKKRKEEKRMLMAER